MQYSIIPNLRESDAFLKEAILSKQLYLPSEKVYYKRKEFAPVWSKFFPFRVHPFLRRELVCEESKQDVTKVISLVKKWRKFNRAYPFTLKKTSFISETKFIMLQN